MNHVVDMDREQGQKLLREPMEIADQAAHRIRWTWKVDDPAIRDERSTMHRVDEGHWPQQRLTHRCTIS